MSMSQDEIDALNESMKQLNEATTLMVQTLGAVSNQSNLTARSMSKVNTVAKDSSEDIDALGGSSIKTKGALDNLERSTTKQRQNQDLLRKASQQAMSAVTGFGDALLSTEPGISKYGGTVKSATQSMGSLVSMLGPLGKVLGVFIKLAGILGAEALESGNNLFKARSELIRVGGAGSYSAEELEKLALAARVSHRSMDDLVKPLKSLGPSVLIFGGSVGDAQQKFIQLTEDLDDADTSRLARLGMMLPDIIQGQADYFQLQRSAGMQIANSLKTQEQMRKSSINYITNLLELASLTGLEVEDIKKKQQAAVMEERFQIDIYRMQVEGADMMRRGREIGDEELKERGRQLIATAEANKQMVANLGAQAPEVVEGVREFIASGGNVIGKESARVVALLGIDLYKMIEERDRRIMSGMDGTEVGAELATSLASESENAYRAVMEGAVGDIMRYSTDIIKTYFGEGGGPEVLARIINNAARDFEEILGISIGRMGAAMEEGASEIGDFAANAQMTERDTQRALQEVAGTIRNTVIGALEWLAAAASWAARTLSGMTRAGKERIAQEDRRIRIGELSVQIASADRSLTKEEIESRAIQMYEQEIAEKNREEQRRSQERVYVHPADRASMEQQRQTPRIELTEEEINKELDRLSNITRRGLGADFRRSADAQAIHRLSEQLTVLEEARSRNQQDIELPADNVGPPQAVSAPEAPAASPEAPEAPEVPAASPEAPAVPAAATARVSSPRNIEVIATVPTPEQVTTQVMPEQQATATPAPQIAQNNVENNTARGLEEMTYTLASKLDRVIDLLDNGNDTQERLYRATV